MAAWIEGDVPTNGITTHYYRTGGNKPPLVLAHGLTDNGLCWTRIARAMEQDYDVIMLDARGHGRSEAPTDGYTAENRAADLADAIRALDLGQPALMGHSMGADVAATAAALYPDLVRCVILEDPPWFAQGPEQAPEQTPEERAAMAAQWEAGLSTQQSTPREQLIAGRRVVVPVWDEVELEPWADAKLSANPNIFSWLAEPRTPWQEFVSRITCPTLLITADAAAGAIVTTEVAEEFQRLLPSGKVVRIVGAGHNIRREQFEPFLDAVRAFLREV